MPTATDVANDVVSALSGTFTTIETDLTNLPSTLTTDLLSALTGPDDPLTVITTDLTNIAGDLSGLSTTETLIATELPEILSDLTDVLKLI